MTNSQLHYIISSIWVAGSFLIPGDETLFPRMVMILIGAGWLFTGIDFYSGKDE